MIPYSPTDSIRWEDATFESWSSLSYRTDRGAVADRMIGYSPLRVKNDQKNRQLNQPETQTSDKLRKENKNRDLGVTRWEVGGMAGERRYFFYQADTAKHVLYLQNKNINARDERQVLHYSRPTPTGSSFRAPMNSGIPFMSCWIGPIKNIPWWRDGKARSQAIDL